MDKKQSVPDSQDPAQGELHFGGKLPSEPFLSSAPWQVEIAYRIGLNATVVFTASATWRLLEITLNWLQLEQHPWAITVVHLIFQASFVGIAFVMVALDFIRFCYRRTPTSWKEKVHWLKK